MILNDIFEPKVNIKLLFDRNSSNSYSLMCWDDVKRDAYQFIEWLKINPIKREYIGKLVNPKSTDYNELIESKLIENHIPYVLENGIFVIYGYK